MVNVKRKTKDQDGELCEMSLAREGDSFIDLFHRKIMPHRDRTINS